MRSYIKLKQTGKWLILAIAATATAPVLAATYTYTGAPLSVIYNSCSPPGNPTAGPCVAYTAAMNVHGSFTLATPLPSNFGPADISTRSDLTWSFSDGINTYSSSDSAHASIEPGFFKVQTDAAGVPIFSGTSIALDLWQTTPGVNHYIDFLDIGYRPFSPPVGDYANTGWQCFTVSGNECTSDNYGPNIANAASAAAGTWVVAGATPTAGLVPAPLFETSQTLALAGGLLLIGMVTWRRARAS